MPPGTNSGTAKVKYTGLRKPVVVIPDPLSARIFFDCGVLGSMKDRMGDVVVVFRGAQEAHLRLYEKWAALYPDIEYIWEDQEELQRKISLTEKIYRYVDNALDSALGWFPLALRFNMKHGFHLERMAPNHRNGYLDTNRLGFLPCWDWLYPLMFSWVFNSTRYVKNTVTRLAADRSSVLILANVQHPGMHDYIVAARRHGTPVIAYIASWDHPVGKGVIYPSCQQYIVQNNAMKKDLVRFHHIEAAKIIVTGWPQTDIFAGKRTQQEFRRLVESYGLDPDKRLVLITGNTRTNAPNEPQFLERFLAWRDTEELDVSILFRPHPKDRKWNTRFSNIDLQQKDFYVQSASYTDVLELACLLQHVDCVVTHAGTILLDALVNGRPVVCVLYDEASEEAVKYAEKNVIGKHYEDLMRSGSFLTAHSMEEVTAGVRKVLSTPGLFEAERKAVSQKVVGDLDGQAASRVANAIDAWLQQQQEIRSAA